MPKESTKATIEQLAMQARARREEIRHEGQEGFYTKPQCWQDEPEQCENMPVFHILQLDGKCYYSCRSDVTELVENLPDIPLYTVASDAKIH
jgi:hypothetical protein